MIREDLGRHNALDKVIGALRRAGIAADSGFFVITSYCSFTMVRKPRSSAEHAGASLSAASVAFSRARG